MFVYKYAVIYAHVCIFGNVYETLYTSPINDCGFTAQCFFLLHP